MSEELDGRIVASAAYGKHIPLTCKNHPNLRWNTKNIAPIGARTIFYKENQGPECTCTVHDLRPL